MRIGQGNMHLELKTFDSPLKKGNADPSSFAASLLAEGGASERSAVPTSYSKPILMPTSSQDDIQAANDAVAKEFLEWAQMSPEEKLRAQILKSKDLDEESLKALPPEEREAIEAEISEAIKQAFGVDDMAGLARPRTDEAGASAGI
jgi:hypothetical protein